MEGKAGERVHQLVYRPLGADFDTKTSLFLNTGDLPDIVWLRNSSSVIANYGDLGYFLNFMDYLDYMPNLKNYLDTYPQIARMVTDDGRL